MKPAPSTPPHRTRRDFLARSALAATGVALGSTATPASAAAAKDFPVRPPASGSQRRWRTAFGLNGFMSSEREFGNSFAIWEVLDFAQREGFEGIELVGGWPKPYPSSDDKARIDALRSFYARYNVKPFSIQTSAGGAFRKDPEARTRWLQGFTDQVRLAARLGCECVGIWPGGGLRGQTLEEARDRLIETLRAAVPVIVGEGLMASVEIEPPFAFRTIEDLIAIVDGVDHPQVRGMYDPSHFDLMNGGKGKPEELLEKLGVHRLGYIHLTDTDGTIFGGTSKHLPCGDGHVDMDKSFEILWKGGYEGWIMIDAWKIEDPYDACRKGRAAIVGAQRRLRAR